MARVLQRVPAHASHTGSASRQYVVYTNGKTVHHRIDDAESASPQVVAVSTDSTDPENELLEAARECQRMIDNSYGSRQTTRPTATETAPETPRKHATNAGNSAPKITELTERTTKSATARVQLRLTHGMVRILKAFKGAGTHPSQIVETALWRDGRIKDAATLLRVPETGESN